MQMFHFTEGYSLRHWVPKDRTGLDFQTLVVEEQHLAVIKKVMHTVTVCAWLSVGFPN